jgi:L-ascorbate metabolism protein UlaG (beta-lactamase superfamily)
MQTRMMFRRATFILIALIALGAFGPAFPAKTSHVDMTWMSISNMYYEINGAGILTDGYFTRIPQAAFYGGGGGLANTRMAYKPDVDSVTRVLSALGGKEHIQLLLTGHSHFDHSFDTATWSKLTGARIVGSHTTCLQVVAQGIPAGRCHSVDGGEKINIADGVTMRVVRWNHSGDTATNPEQHNPVELTALPRLEADGGLHAGVAEDFPNGGGTRAFLFTVEGTQGRVSWFYQNSGSAADLKVPIVIDGKNYGAPIENLKTAMKDAGLQSVDLWIGTGGAPMAKLVLGVLKPKTYLPVHWDGLYGAFDAGVRRPYADPPLEEYLATSGVQLIKPAQYMDKWRLDTAGFRSIENTAVKHALGFKN